MVDRLGPTMNGGFPAATGSSSSLLPYPTRPDMIANE